MENLGLRFQIALMNMVPQFINISHQEFLTNTMNAFLTGIVLLQMMPNRDFNINDLCDIKLDWNMTLEHLATI